MGNRERCAVSCSTLDIYFSVYVPNDTEDLNLYLVNMITGINESKTLTKRISCTFECKFYNKNLTRIKIIIISVSVSSKIQKEHHVSKKLYLESCNMQLQKYMEVLVTIQ